MFQTYVQAEDNGNPSLYDIAVARFIIDRNRNGPQFTTTSITIDTNEDTAPGTVIGSCNATDADSMPAIAGVCRLIACSLGFSLPQMHCSDFIY